MRNICEKVCFTFDTVAAHQSVWPRSFFSSFSLAFGRIRLRLISSGPCFCRLQLDPDKCFRADRFFLQLFADFSLLIFVALIKNIKGRPRKIACKGKTLILIKIV